MNSLSYFSSGVVIFLAFFFCRDILVSASGTIEGPHYIKWEDLGFNTNQFNKLVVVDQNGNGDFLTVQAAIDKVPKYNIIRHKIFIHPGIYREKVTVPSGKDYITFIGVQNRTSQTVISWSESTTVTVEAEYFCATNITFESSVVAPRGSKNNSKQISSLKITGDKAFLYRVRVLGTKNTILDERGHHYFLDSFIQGADKFIVGNATSLYQDCTINSVTRGEGVIAISNKNKPDSSEGFAFLGCDITGTGKLLLSVASGKYSRVAFSYCDFGCVIAPPGWSDGRDAAKQKTVIFGEFKSSGKGAIRTKRAPWLKPFTSSDAFPFLSRDFIDGQHWLQF